MECQNNGASEKCFGKAYVKCLCLVILQKNCFISEMCFLFNMLT